METNTTNKGVTAYDLIKCAKKYGFNAIGYKDTNLTKYKHPCILHLKINESLSHFVTLYEIKKSTYTIMDPAKGLIKMSVDELNKKFTGVLIILEPISSLPVMKNENIIRKELTNQLKRFKPNLSKIITLEIIIIILNIISSFYIKIFSLKKYLYILSILFILISILIEIISYTIYKSIYNLENKINFNLSNYFFSYILKLPLKYLHLKDPGEIVKRANEISLINEILLNTFIDIIIDSLIILGIIPILISQSLPATIIILIIIVVISILSVLTTKSLKSKSKEAIEAATEYNNFLIDGIYGLTSIKHSRSGNFLKERLSSSLESRQIKEKDYNLSLKRYNTAKKSLLSFLKILINLYLINKIYQGELSFEAFIIVNTLIEIIVNAAANVTSSLMELSFIKNLFAKANDFYNIPIKENTNAKKFEFGAIKFNNINFNYTGSYPLIKNFTTTIKMGEKVIIKGESGTGKSTLCKMLYQEISDFSGKISINNINIKNIDTSDFQKHIIYSSQVERIFSASIKENILLGKTIAENKLNKIIEICELNRILDKRALGLDTMLFSGGEELSGGERQLIILARALVNEFSILILDETLSEVNDEVEDKILKKLFSYYTKQTIIYITHKNNKKYFSRIINV